MSSRQEFSLSYLVNKLQQSTMSGIFLRTDEKVCRAYILKALPILASMEREVFLFSLTINRRFIGISQEEKVVEFIYTQILPPRTKGVHSFKLVGERIIINYY